jgi:hypothetical protein
VNGANVTLTCTLRNIGRTPAQQLQISPYIITPTSGAVDPVAEQARECANPPIKASGDRFGEVLFPDEPNNPGSHQTITNTITTADLRLAANKFPFLSPFVYGCVQYKVAAGDGQDHQTGFIYMITLNDGKMIDPSRNNSPGWLTELAGAS